MLQDFCPFLSHRSKRLAFSRTRVDYPGQGMFWGSHTVTSVSEMIVNVPVKLGGRDGWPVGLDGRIGLPMGLDGRIGLPVGLDGRDRLPDGGGI